MWDHLPVKPQQVARPRHLDHLQDDERGYPVISTVARGEGGINFGSINERRKLALATFDWCAVCGLPFGRASRWQVLAGAGQVLPGRGLEGEIYFSEAPAHEICIVYASHVCPHLSSPRHRMGDNYRAGQRRDDKIRVAGFDRTSKVQGFRSGLQKDIHVLHFAQSGFTDEFAYSRPEELVDRYAALLASEKVPELSPADSGLIRLFNEHSDAGDTVCGAALMAGASFAKDIKKVQGIEVFAESGYWLRLALYLLDPDKIADFGQDNGDPASGFMAGWLLERQSNLPGVLGGWREAGHRLARSRGIPLPDYPPGGRGRSVVKNAPCPCGSGRRAPAVSSPGACRRPTNRRPACAPAGLP